MTEYADMLREDGLVVFLFHGVIEKQNAAVRNYTRKHLEKNYFAQVCASLAIKGRALSMDEVISYHETGEGYPPYSFAITFDDGFENNVSVAAPVLADLGIPTMFYITSGFLDDNAMSWIDRIEYCLEYTEAGRLQLPWHGEAQEFRSAEDRIRILDDIRHHAKRDHSLDLHVLADDIYIQAGMVPVYESEHSLDQKMTWEQARKLAESELFSIGGHTHTHPVMSFLSPEELSREIDLSLEKIKEHTGKIVEHFSYPEGMDYCFSSEVITALKERDITCCPTAMPGTNTKADDLFHLKRVTVL